VADSLQTRISAARSIYSALSPWLIRYRGGMPVGFAAAIIQMESGGKMIAGDPSLGEYGYMQVAANTPPSFGYPASLRTEPEGNVFLGLLELNVEAVKQALNDARIVLGSDDSWKLARLGFAIGSGGTRTLLANSKNFAGGPWAAIRAYLAQTGGLGLGSQSAQKVADRVAAVDIAWEVGQAVSPGSGGIPAIPPPPAGLNPPSISQGVLARIASARTAQMLGLAIVGAGAWYLWKRSR
jgi:hypothetical protein